MTSSRSLRQRLLCHGRLKLTLLVVLPVLFGLGYFGLQQFTLTPPMTFQLTAFDRAIPFSPNWVYTYQSLYFLMPVVPLLLVEKAGLARYVRGFAWVSVFSFLIFLIFPVLSPRPDGLTGVAAFDLLARFEGKLNAFPSLHAGLLAYTLIFARWAFPNELRTTLGRCLFSLGLLWGVAILYATLATKQHYTVDLPAGIALAWLAHRWSGYTLSLRRNLQHGETHG